MEKELEEWYKLHKFYKYSDYLTKDLADYLSVSPRTIQRWLIGKAAPSKEKKELIRTYLAKKTSEYTPKTI